MFRTVKQTNKGANFVLSGMGFIYGGYNAETVVTLGTDLFISTDSSSGDIFSRGALGDDYSRASSDDGFKKGGGKA